MNADPARVRDAARGDKEAFSEIFGAVSAELYRYALYMLRNREDAQDAVMQCALEAYKSVASLRTPEAFRKWIFTILTRVIKKRQKELIKAREHEERLDAAEICSLENMSEKVAASVQLMSAIDSLGELDRRILLLSLVSGYSGKEVARMTKISHAAVRSRLSRLTAKLRKEMEGNGECK